METAQLELFESLLTPARFARKPRFLPAKGEASVIRPFRYAPQFPYMQAQAPGVAYRIVVDIDRDVRALARCNDWANLLNVPTPSYVLLNRANGHCHLAYELEVGVATHEAARTAPLRYLAAVEYALCEALGGDVGYAGYLYKSPFSPEWELLEGRRQPYSLGELSDYLALPRSIPKKPIEQGFGRNCSLFHELRTWAYSACSRFGSYECWCRSVLEHAVELNCRFPTPMTESEVRAIARSVAKWVWRNLGQGTYGQRFSERQRFKQSKAAANRRLATTADVILAISKLKASGKRVSMTAVAKEIGCSQQNLSKRYKHLF